MREFATMTGLDTTTLHKIHNAVPGSRSSKKLLNMLRRLKLEVDALKDQKLSQLVDNVLFDVGEMLNVNDKKLF